MTDIEGASPQDVWARDYEAHLGRVLEHLPELRAAHATAMAALPNYLDDEVRSAPAFDSYVKDWDAVTETLNAVVQLAENAEQLDPYGVDPAGQKQRFAFLREGYDRARQLGSHQEFLNRAQELMKSADEPEVKTWLAQREAMTGATLESELTAIAQNPTIWWLPEFMAALMAHIDNLAVPRVRFGADQIQTYEVASPMKPLRPRSGRKHVQHQEKNRDLDRSARGIEKAVRALDPAESPRRQPRSAREKYEDLARQQGEERRREELRQAAEPGLHLGAEVRRLILEAGKHHGLPPQSLDDCLKIRDWKVAFKAFLAENNVESNRKSAEKYYAAFRQLTKNIIAYDISKKRAKEMAASALVTTDEELAERNSRSKEVIEAELAKRRGLPMHVVETVDTSSLDLNAIRAANQYAVETQLKNIPDEWATAIIADDNMLVEVPGHKSTALPSSYHKMFDKPGRPLYPAKWDTELNCLKVQYHDAGYTKKQLKKFFGGFTDIPVEFENAKGRS
ncbi:hypothetical protein AB0M48_38640 [Lentzea sp. NPDC051208]|uniref:hypothetical protein n=1 Tax=Lentzea sp. NPDC051208 TaxID=3154642 RepID=UPI003418DC65